MKKDFISLSYLFCYARSRMIFWQVIKIEKFGQLQTKLEKTNSVCKRPSARPSLWGQMVSVMKYCHKGGSRKIQRLIRVSLSTEFFSKRRKNYTFWRETRAGRVENTKTIPRTNLKNNLWCVVEKEEKSSDSKLIKFGKLIVEFESFRRLVFGDKQFLWLDE